MKKLIKISCLFILSTSLLFATGTKEQSSTPSTVVPQNDQKTQIITENLNSLGYLYSLIDTLSINELDDDKAFEEMAGALVDSLGDEYSYYVPKEFAKEYQEDSTGTYGGIGTYLIKRNPKDIDLDDSESYMLKIISPFPGGPSDRAGLKSNDLISHINSEPVNKLTGTEASLLLRGEPNTEVTITVHRGSSSFDLTLSRELVETPTTDHAIIKDHIGYLVITQFTSKTSDQTLEVINDMLDENIDSLIIDLRNNGGGIVEDATRIANFFLNGQTIVTSKYKETLDNKEEKTVSTKQVIVPPNFPLVLLVNGGSASSSEILTGALKDNGRATVIGTQTFGKGIMQQVFAFKEGFVQFTVANYLTPNGTNIHKIGITPDIVVEDHELSEEEVKAYEQIMKDDAVGTYVDENPEYSKENIENFANSYNDVNVYKPFLNILARNEYLYRMDYKDRPKFDLNYDNYLSTAVDFLEK